MPPKKKISSSKKKAQKKGSCPHPAAEVANASYRDDSTSTIDVTKAKPTISTECADAFAALFSAEYPPKFDVDDYAASLSKRDINLADRAYNECSANFNRGLKHMMNENSPNPSPTNSRWHLGRQALLDAIESAMKFPGVFLKTRGSDHRNLLCKVALSIGQCQGNLLDGKGMAAWGKAAIAADPKYFNGYSKCSLGLQHDRKYKEALDVCKKTLKAEGFEFGPPGIKREITARIEALENIVNAEQYSKEWKVAVRTILIEKRGNALRYYQACNMEKPKKTCAMCFWPAENMRCSKCLTVYYCHKDCQYAHYSEHKPNCIKTKDKGDSDEAVSYPKPDYPRSEWISDEHYAMFQQSAKAMKYDMIQCAANNCNLQTLKRALMQERDAMEKINSIYAHEYPIHRAALRNEPNAAVDICKILIKHGACPNVYRGDSVHLLDICRGRAKWIDDQEPSTENSMFRMLCQMKPGMLEKVERKESADLVELITEAIRNHTRCRLCRKQNATCVNYNDYKRAFK